MTTHIQKQFESSTLRILTGVSALIVAAMPVHAFVSTWLGTRIGPLLLWKSWKEVLLLALMPLAVWYAWRLRPDVGRVLWRRPVNQLIVLYTLLHVLLSFSSTASIQAVVAGLAINVRFLALFVVVQLIVEAHPAHMIRFKRLAPRWLLWAGIGLGVLAALQVFVLPRDFLTHFGYGNTTIAPYILVDENPNALRAFATMRGPNALGAYLILPIAVALCAVYRRRSDLLAWVALALSLAGVLLTGSRSAWLAVVVTVVCLSVVAVPWSRMKRWVLWGAGPVAIALILLGWAALYVPAVRLAIFHSSPSDSSLNEGSNNAHWQATARGVADVIQHPFGSGPGSAGPASFYSASGVKLSENYFVQIGQEVGVIGLGLFVAINVLAALALVRRRDDPLALAVLASLAGLTLVNIFLHGWADDPTALTWWALAGLYIGRK